MVIVISIIRIFFAASSIDVSETEIEQPRSSVQFGLILLNEEGIENFIALIGSKWAKAVPSFALIRTIDETLIDNSP